MGAQEAEQHDGEVRSPGLQLPKQSFIWKWQAAEPGFGDETRAGGAWQSHKHVDDIHSHGTYLRSSREDTHKRPLGLS